MSEDLPDAPWLAAPAHEELPDAPWMTQAPGAAPQAGGISAQVVKGIPVVGGLAQKGAAAANAALDPVVGAVRHWRGAPELPGTQGTYGERYAHHLDELRAADAATEREHPVGSAALQAAGGLAAFGGGARLTGGLTAAATPAVGGAVLGGTTGGLGRRMATSGAANAVLGGADAATRDQDIGTGAAIGGALGAAGPVVGRMVGSAVNRWRGTTHAAVPPTAQAEIAAGDAGYDAARASNFTLHPAGAHDISHGIENDLHHDFGGPGPASLAPLTYGVLGRMREPLTAGAGYAPINANQIMGLRQQLRRIVENPQAGSDGAAAGRALEAFDNYLGNVPAHHVLQGDPVQFGESLTEANHNYGAGRRSERFHQDVIENAGRNADVAHAGENLGNNTRQRLNAYIKSNQRGTELGRGANADEIAEADRVARGTGFANGARRVQSWTGGLKRGVVASGLGVAAANHFGLPWEVGAAAPHVISDVARRAAEASTVRGAHGVDELLRRRAPLSAPANAAQAQAGATNNAAMQGGAFASRAAGTPIARMLQQTFDQPEEQQGASHFSLNPIGTANAMDLPSDRHNPRPGRVLGEGGAGGPPPPERLNFKSINAQRGVPAEPSAPQAARPKSIGELTPEEKAAWKVRADAEMAAAEAKAAKKKGVASAFSDIPASSDRIDCKSSGAKREK